MTFVEDDGTEIKVEAELGATLLEVAHENDVELEGNGEAGESNRGTHYCTAHQVLISAETKVSSSLHEVCHLSLARCLLPPHFSSKQWPEECSTHTLHKTDFGDFGLLCPHLREDFL